jgi:E3 ubiquitin-protein ligase UBR1
MGRNMPITMWVGTLKNCQTSDPIMSNFAEFALAITKTAMEFQVSRMDEEVVETENLGFQQSGVDTLEGWHTFAKKYALTFLRKCVVFLHVKYGVDFSSHMSSNPDAEELERLTEALQVPSFDEMCAALTVNGPQCGWPSTTTALVTAWIKHQVLSPRSFSEGSPSAIVSHPGIFELIGLPKNFDLLIEEATRRRCPTTGKDLTDPVICLFCGDVFCSQGTCCHKPDPTGEEHGVIGGAQYHMRRYVHTAILQLDETANQIYADAKETLECTLIFESAQLSTCSACRALSAQRRTLTNTARRIRNCGTDGSCSSTRRGTTR